MPSRAALSGGQKNVAPFTLRTEQALLPQRNLRQTKELERLLLCGRLLREVGPSLPSEVIAAWNLTAANAPKNLVCVPDGIRSAILSQPTRRCWNCNPAVARAA